MKMPYLAVKAHQRTIQVSHLAYACRDENLRSMIKNDDHETRHARLTTMMGYVIQLSNIRSPRVVNNVETPFVARTVNPPTFDVND